LISRRLVIFPVLLAALAAVPSSAGPSTPAAGEPGFAFSRPIDRRQQSLLDFGLRSHWLQPWRAYLETVPASRLRNGLGIVFNVQPKEAERTAQLLAAVGFRRARIEIGWSNVAWSRRPRLKNAGRYRVILRALQRHGLRPLILLNANHGYPGPLRRSRIRVTQPAPAGARTLELDRRSAALVTPGRTGLDSTTDYKAADILFASIEGTTVALSKPLPRDMAAGNYSVTTLRYEPFRRPDDPLFEETMRGWLDYVGLVTRQVKSILGNESFDVEIWNELSFGSDFLDLNRYYDHEVVTGDPAATQDTILRRTIAFLRDPDHGVSRIGIGNGFASERPWEAGSTSPVGLTAIDKHPYSRRVSFPQPGRYKDARAVNPLGRIDERQDEAGAWHDAFSPSYSAFLPEYYLTAIQTEHLVRDLSPFATDLLGTRHGRFTHPRGSQPPVVWLTEFGLDLDQVPAAAVRHIKTKMALRAAAAWINKGAGALYFYAVHHGRWALYKPGAEGGGQVLRALKRFMSAFAGPDRLRHRQHLRLEAVADRHHRRQFEGDGTPAHPPLYDRDVVAFLPFQVAERRVVVPVYVMTRDLLRAYRPGLGRGDPRRYDLPPESFRLTIGGVAGLGATVRATDPLSGKDVPVRVVSRGRGRLVVELALTDSPRLLVLG
jgi:hypothetical protein